MDNISLNIIALHDGKDGHVSQLKFICNALVKAYEVNAINYFQHTSYFFINQKQKEYANNLIYQINSPKALIIAVGKRTFNMAKYLKKHLLVLNIDVKLVYLMPPNSNKDKIIDLVFFNKVKQNKQINNFVPITGTPSNTNEIIKRIDVIKLAQHPLYKNLKDNVITILLGGDAKNIKLTKAAIDDLCKELIKINQLYEGNVSFVLSTTRRTPSRLEEYIENQFKRYKFNSVLFFYHQNIQQTKEQYFNMLALANKIIVSCESTSMLSEACNLIDINVYVFTSKNFYAKRYYNFYNYLVTNNYAEMLDKFIIVNHNKLQLNSLGDTMYNIDKIIK